MHVSYKGIKADLTPKLQEKLDAKFGKLSKLLERRGEQEAHVVMSSERHLHHAEITLRYYDHQLVCVGSDTDVFSAIGAALDKLEKQAVKQRGKWREKSRRGATPKSEEPELIGVVAQKGQKSRDDQVQIVHRVFRVNHHDGRKPMTLEEALLEMEQDRDYVVYRDAQKDCMSVLLRRRDGNFDLIES